MSISTHAGYEPLTENTAIALAIRLRLFESENGLQSQEIGDGNLNLVFRIYDEKSKKGIIIKQALPYAKVVGESWPLTLKRATIESNALLTTANYVPNLVPKVYYADEQLAITVMEDLSHLQILRKGLIENRTYPLLAQHIGTFLARTHFYTSDLGLSPQEKKNLVQKFSNPELCKITEDLVFTDPFFDHDTNQFERELSADVQKLWEDSLLKLEVAKLKQKFLTQADALLHGDLHTGSIFADEHETKVIDPEFAFFGPLGFDSGQFIANILLNLLSKPSAKQEELLNTVYQTWDVFEKTFTALCEQESVEVFTKVDGYVQFVIRQSLENSVGFAGCEIIRRTIGLAHVADLDGIENLDERIKAKRSALKLGRELILNRSLISNIRDLKKLIENVYAV
ncbi:S-methyl-5-thioribose kinase [Bacillus timonensis]|nr:S-methyl-5-thioribose kinase [Bacillus timonensis]